MGRQGDGARMTARIVLRPGGAGRVLGCGNFVGAGSVLSDSERVSRSECYQGYTRSTKPLVRASVYLHTRVFGLMGE